MTLLSVNALVNKENTINFNKKSRYEIQKFRNFRVLRSNISQDKSFFLIFVKKIWIYWNFWNLRARVI